MDIVGIAYVRFESADLAATEVFAKDFGLLTVDRREDRLVMKTSGSDAFSYVAHRADKPGFVGFGVAVANAADLDAAVERHGAVNRRTLGTPGGGEAVTLTDPNGFKIDLVHGLSLAEETASSTPDLRYNSPSTRPRQGESQGGRPFGPATLFRLGHVGLFVSDFAKTSAWYRDTLGLIGSDVYHVPHDPEHKIVGFFRMNHGATWVDHHTVALMQRDVADCHHISFEVQDFEAQFMAHRWLESRGYEQIWGVGRHPHGSHIFDVWRDPNGVRFETFSDTDLLNEANGTRIHNIKDVQMDMWSSDPPDRYFA